MWFRGLDAESMVTYWLGSHNALPTVCAQRARWGEPTPTPTPSRAKDNTHTPHTPAQDQDQRIFSRHYQCFPVPAAARKTDQLADFPVRLGKSAMLTHCYLGHSARIVVFAWPVVVICKPRLGRRAASSVGAHPREEDLEKS